VTGELLGYAAVLLGLVVGFVATYIVGRRDGSARNESDIRTQNRKTVEELWRDREAAETARRVREAEALRRSIERNEQREAELGRGPSREHAEKIRRKAEKRWERIKRKLS